MLAFLALGAAANAAEPVVAASPDEQRAMLESDDPQLEANKRLVWDMWREFLQAGDIEAADKYLAPEYHQHNPNADTGLEAVKAYFRAAGMQKTEVKDYIERLVAITAERDLVTLALVREGTDSNGEAYTTTWFDMFRVEDGMIVEHWDTATRD
ncbi:MAG: nuclear transport factor 2 family protein [Gammaproteobacteria bacterium]|nr:nuclear transport factor 2 family protein [Gammaproteobacteria bacterium]